MSFGGGWLNLRWERILPMQPLLATANRARRKLLIGGDGVPVAEFLSRPVADWASG